MLVLFCCQINCIFHLFRLTKFLLRNLMADERYEIERIVDKRYRNNGLEYLIKWRGYPDSQNTWEPC